MSILINILHPLLLVPDVIDTIFVETENVGFITSVNQESDIPTNTTRMI